MFRELGIEPDTPEKIEQRERERNQRMISQQ